MHGGAERVLVNLVNFLDKDKYDVVLQTIFDCGVNKEFLKDTVKYKSNFRRIYRGVTWGMKIFSPRFLYNSLIGEEYDIIVSFLEGPTARILAGCQYKKSKKIAWIHIEQRNKSAFSRSFRSYQEATLMYNQYDEIVCVSKTVQEDFCSLFDCKAKVSVLYNVNDTENILKKAQEKVDDYNLNSEVPLFCSVAKITKTKGYDRLLEVHKRLLSEGYPHKIVLIGTGEDEEKIRKKAKREKVDRRFQLLGFKKNPYKYMKLCDGYICSSYREGFSTAVTEALILGLATISTRCSGAEELLGSNNEYGIITENSTQGLYLGMKEMLQTKDNIQKYKNRALIRGETFSAETTVKAVESLLDNMCYKL